MMSLPMRETLIRLRAYNELTMIVWEPIWLRPIVVKIFSNGVKIGCNGQNQEGAMCTLHVYVSKLKEKCACVMYAYHTNN